MKNDHRKDAYFTIANTVGPSRAVGFELLLSLMLMSQGDPATLSWQPVAQQLKQMDAAKSMLERGIAKHFDVEESDLPTELREARLTALSAIKSIYSEILTLTKATQIEPIPLERFDEVSVKLRMSLRPEITKFLDHLARFSTG